MDTSPVTYKLKDLLGEDIEGSFYEPELQKSFQEVFRLEKVLKQDPVKKLALVKWKGYDERFNSWVKLSELKNIYKIIFSIALIYKIYKCFHFPFILFSIKRVQIFNCI